MEPIFEKNSFWKSSAFKAPNLQVFFILVHIIKAKHMRMFDEFHYGDLSFHL